MSDHALFAVAPYLAVLLCIATLFASLRSTGVSAPAHTPYRSLGAALFSRRSGVVFAWLVLIAAHVALIAAPQLTLSWNRSPARRLGFELTLVVCGTIVLIDLVRSTMLRARRTDVWSSGSVGHTAWLAALVMAVASGLAMALIYRWASLWSTVTLTPFVRSLVRLQPDVQVIATMPYVVKLHLFCGIALLALWPFAHGVHTLLRRARRIVQTRTRSRKAVARALLRVAR